MPKFLITLALLLSSAALAAGQTADTIYYNGKVITVWDAHPIVEAFAIRATDSWRWARTRR